LGASHEGQAAKVSTEPHCPQNAFPSGLALSQLGHAAMASEYRRRNNPLIGRVPTNMQVDIFSDVVCPWCAVGKRRFEAALGQFAHADEIEVVWRAFELDPHAPVVREGDYASRLAKKYGMTREQAVAANERLTAAAAVEGLDFHFDRAKPGNTFDAHRLLHYARAAGYGLQDALKERLLVAYFTEGAAIGEPETLVRLAAEVGLDARECADILAGDRYAGDVRADENEALELGVTGVPFFVVDGKFGIPGAQDAETILNVLKRAWTKAHPLEMAVAPAGSDVCEGDSCAL
jgi:predicted DsbA family dithiol-disulfide isomerase